MRWEKNTQVLYTQSACDKALKRAEKLGEELPILFSQREHIVRALKKIFKTYVHI